MTTPFRFKQFSVHQDAAAMKVGFDGILLGAWADVSGCRRVLDIGTGTGLIALMTCQRALANTHIDTIDIDLAAATEAAENFARSPWAHRIASHHASLSNFTVQTRHRYDLVTCNPPFFKSDPQSSMPSSRSTARQDGSLDLVSLFQNARELTAATGRLTLIVPIARQQECATHAGQTGWQLRRILHVRPTPEKTCHRCLLEYSVEPVRGAPEYQEIAIEQQRHVYTPEYRNLARDFYLSF